jgi:hypothetical protein
VNKITIAALAALAIIGTAAPALASSATPSAPASNAGITVGPTRVELNVRPGRKTTQIFTVAAQQVALRVTSEVVALTQNSKGQLTIAHPNLPGSVTGMSWAHVSPAAGYRLPPETNHQFKVTIDPPAQLTDPGAQRYLAVIFTGFAVGNKAKASKGGKIGSGVAIAGSIDAEMFLNTPGKTVRDTVFGLHVPWISFGGPISITASVADKGNTLALLNDQRISAAGSKVNLPSMLMLSGGSRTVVTVWQHPSYGIDHVSWQGKSGTVIVIPGTVLWIFIGLILMVLGAMLYLRSLRRRANQRRHGGGNGGPRRHGRGPAPAGAR